MRFIRLTLIVLLVSAFQRGWAQQAQSDAPVAAREFNIQKSVHIFPNPAVEFIDVEVTEFPVQNMDISVHNIIGNRIDIETEVIDEHTLRVKVKDLASGYYLLAIKDPESKFRGTYKFLKR